jgi:Chaperone of endosialidase
MRLRPVHYRWKDARLNKDKPEFGFIAQEVEEVMPELVYEAPQAPDAPVKLPGNKSKALFYQRFVVPAILAIQQLKAEFDGNRAELVKLKAANDNQAAALKAANDNTAALRKEFEAYKAAHP